MELTNEVLDEALRAIDAALRTGGKVEAVRILHNRLGFGLRESYEYANRFGRDIPALRNALAERLGLSAQDEAKPSVRVFENVRFRLELKRPEDTTFDHLNELFAEVADALKL